jgi:hypothetical protein
MQLFLKKKNNIVSTGKPFVIYNKLIKPMILWDYRIPVRDSYDFSWSDIKIDKSPFTA